MPVPWGLFGPRVGAGSWLTRAGAHVRSTRVHAAPPERLISTAGILSHSTWTACVLSEEILLPSSVLCTKGNRLCSPCSATLSIAAATWSGRRKGFVPWSSSSEGEKLLPPCQAVLLCPLGNLWKRNVVTPSGISRREVFHH